MNKTTSTTSSLPTTKQHRRFFAVKKLICRRTDGKKWYVVALYNDTNNFLGPADKFESKEEAQKYIESYKKRMNDRRMDKFGRAKSSISLKVFTVVVDDDDGEDDDDGVSMNK